jgi:hypothetical protein
VLTITTTACSAGKKVIGGGFTGLNADVNFVLLESGPVTSDTQWRVRIASDSPNQVTGTVTVSAFCATY